MSVKTNFFEEIAKLMIDGSIVNLRIMKTKNGELGIILFPEFDDDLVDKNKIPNFTIGGPISEVDESFFSKIDEVMDASNAVFSSIDKFKEQLSLVKKDAEKKVKDETKSSDTKKSTTSKAKDNTTQKSLLDKEEEEKEVKTDKKSETKAEPKKDSAEVKEVNVSGEKVKPESKDVGEKEVAQKKNEPEAAEIKEEKTKESEDKSSNKEDDEEWAW